MPELLARDIDFILDQTRSLWRELRGGRIFITGGAGFIGRWLLESFVRANDLLKLDAQVVALTRDPLAFARKAPHLASHPALHLHQGDMRNFEFPDGRFNYVIHAAAQNDPRLYIEHPVRMLDLVLSSTRWVLDFALQCGNPKFLLVSDSAVYGQHAAGLRYIPEDLPNEREARNVLSVYGQGKRLSELLCMTYGQHYRLQIKIGRCFPTIGSYVPLEASGMAGYFIRQGLQGGPILVNGSGASLCSYMYVADQAAWLWKILARGECGGVYNVCSEQAVTVSELAWYVGQSFRPAVAVRYQEEREYPGQESNVEAEKQSAAEWLLPLSDANQNGSLLPSTSAAQRYLQVRQEISLEEAIRRTVEWHCQGSHA